MTTNDNIYSVYVHTCPNGMVYYGVTKNVKQRFQPCLYARKNKLFKELIEEFGWSNIQHEILHSGLDRRTALMIEDSYIVEARKNGVCINKFRSGYHRDSDEFKESMKEYSKNWYLENKERLKSQHHNYYERNKESVLDRTHKYYYEHKEEISEKRRDKRKQAR